MRPWILAIVGVAVAIAAGVTIRCLALDKDQAIQVVVAAATAVSALYAALAANSSATASERINQAAERAEEGVSRTLLPRTCGIGRQFVGNKVLVSFGATDGEIDVQDVRAFRGEDGPNGQPMVEYDRRRWVEQEVEHPPSSPNDELAWLDVNQPPPVTFVFADDQHLVQWRQVVRFPPSTTFYLRPERVPWSR